MDPCEYVPVAADAAHSENDTINLSQLENDSSEGKSEPPAPTSTYYNESILLLKSSLPLNITYLLRYTLNLTTLYVVSSSSSSHKSLSAVSLAIAISNITGFALFEGLVSSLDTLFSQAYGARKYHLVGLYAQKFLCFAALVFLPVAGLWIFSPQILGIFMRDGDMAGLCGQYLRVFILSIPGHVAFEVGKRYVLVQGELLVPLYVTLVTTPMHFCMSWAFVRSFEWGLQGAALATVITHTLNSVFLLFYVQYLKQKCLVCWPGFTSLALKDWGAMIRLSVAGVAIVESEWIAFDILAVCASHISSNSLAAYSIASTTMSVLYQVPLSTSICTSLRIGELLGLGRVDILPKVVKTHFAIGTMAGLVNCVLVLTLASIIPTIFTSNLELQHIARNAFVVVGFVVLFDATTAMTNGILRGIGRQRVGCWVSLPGYYVLTLPLALFLVFGPAKLSTLGPWASLACGLLFITAVEAVYILRVDWNKAAFETEHRNDMI